MDGKTSEWRPGPTVCRCCLTEGCYKDISTEYFWMGKREVYAEMLSDTMNVTIAYSQSGGPNSNSRLICEPCITRLRDATDFKRQVLECEKMFIQHLDGGSTSKDQQDIIPEIIEKDVKLETVKTERRYSDEDLDAGGCFQDDDDDDDMDDQPLTKFATKVPKKEADDLMELLNRSQVSVKRKTVSKICMVSNTKGTRKGLKRNFISLEDKIQILNRLEGGEKLSSVAKSTNLNESTIRTIKKNADNIRKTVENGCPLVAKRVTRTRNSNMVKMERALMIWLEDCVAKKIPISANLIKQKALKIYEHLRNIGPSYAGLDNHSFVASKGWFERLKKRYALQIIQIQGEQASADAEVAEN